MFAPLAFNQESIVSRGLILHLDASDRTSYVPGSNIWRDLSGIRGNSTLTNGPLFNSTKGGSIVFDGTNDYVALFGNSFGYSPGTTGELSLEVWINPTGPFTVYTTEPPVTNLSGVLGQGFFNNSIGWGLGIQVISGIGNCFVFQVRNSSNIVNVGATSTSGYSTFTTNQWYHLIGTFTRNNLSRLYVNGTLTSSTSSVSLNGVNITPSLSDAAISRAGGDGRFYTGCEISVSRLYNYPLTSQEVSQNYNALKGRFGL
jgi:hypothetical protein